MLKYAYIQCVTFILHEYAVGPVGMGMCKAHT